MLSAGTSSFRATSSDSAKWRTDSCLSLPSPWRNIEGVHSDSPPLLISIGGVLLQVTPLALLTLRYYGDLQERVENCHNSREIKKMLHFLCLDSYFFIRWDESNFLLFVCWHKFCFVISTASPLTVNEFSNSRTNFFLQFSYRCLVITYTVSVLPFPNMNTAG